jgi:uncharacterized protein (DUF2235 family)
MSKNIVVFSDGTGQEGGKGHNTNVYKLFNMVEDRTSRQIAFYDRGLGTGWRKITGNGAGMGISKNIKECYEFIFNNYEAGDQIYLFGFSRGATTVRSLAGFIDLFGILPKSRPELIDDAWKIYAIRTSKKEEKMEKRKWRRIVRADEFVKKHRTMWCKIKFIGVWDTVAALGVPFKFIDDVVEKIPGLKHRFHDLSLSDSIENACHALAIDDKRMTFHPEVWSDDNNDIIWPAENIKDKKTLKQVWFCGMHTDVGGGYPIKQLSDITLEWMAHNAEKHGLRLYSKTSITQNSESNPDGHMHDSRAGRFSRFFRKKERVWPQNTEKLINKGIRWKEKPVVHWTVLERKKNQQNEDNPPYSPWILTGDYSVEDRNGNLIDKKDYKVDSTI